MKSVRELKAASPFRDRSLCSCQACLLIGAMLLLAACSSTSTGVSSKQLADAKERADTAEARVAELHESLERTRIVLELARATNREQRDEAYATVVDLRTRLENDGPQILEALPPETPEKVRVTAANALTAVIDALKLTAEVLAPANTNIVAASNPGRFTVADVQSMHTSLDRAQASLDDAQAALTAALNADPAPELRTLLVDAQDTLSTAQISLVPLLREEITRLGEEVIEAERAVAESGNARQAAEGEAAAQRARADTYDPRVSLADALEPREPRFVPRGEAQILRTPRTDTGEAGWEKLDIATDPVAFAAGKRVGAGGGLVPTDELPLRAVTLRAAGRHPIKILGDDGTPDTYSNTDGVLTSSLQLSADGPTLKFGGEGVVYYDMQRTFDYFNDADGTPNHNSWWRYGPDGKLGDASAAQGDTITASHARDLGLEAATGTLTADQATALQGYATDNAGACWRDPLSDCGDWAHDDLAIAFGAPSQSPHGEAAYYWKAQAPFTRAQRDTGLPPKHVEGAGDGRSQDLGTYELWLSSYGGLDEGANADDAGDDTHRYLEYAAYGLFTFFDNVVQTPSFTRPQAFAFGYDAFRDADGMRTTDVSTSIAATFQGHTMARALINGGSETHITLSGATPLRGDVTLNACIGGSGCTGDGIPATANRISGMISGLEELRHDDVWVPFRAAAGGISMEEGAIAADGSFGGQLDHPRLADGTLNTWDYDADIRPGSTQASKYGGNLYGPRDSLEAAGWWHMQVDHRGRALRSSLIGSFGAGCVEGCDEN